MRKFFVIFSDDHHFPGSSKFLENWRFIFVGTCNIFVRKISKWLVGIFLRRIWISKVIKTTFTLKFSQDDPHSQGRKSWKKTTNFTCIFVLVILKYWIQPSDSRCRVGGGMKSLNYFERPRGGGGILRQGKTYRYSSTSIHSSGNFTICMFFLPGISIALISNDLRQLFLLRTCN